MRLLGIILIVLGLAMLVVRGVHLTTTKKVAELGPIEINKKEDHSLIWPLYAGAVAVACGIALVVAAGRQK
jgi:hypothetical protein